MSSFTNIAAYKFAPLTDLKHHRERLTALCKAWRLKGTILLSTEGVNLFVAGAKAEIDLLLAELRSITGLADLQAKFSESAAQPFARMLVKIKKEIIAFGVDGIDPARRPSPKLSGRLLKQWLDEGRPLILLDTRNNFEVRLGTFKNAIPIDIEHFREFPTAVSKLPTAMKDQPIVAFCTGGIRCEKAGPYLEREGFREVYQLDGGILKYFEECGSAHYEGECFVFDQRVGVDPNLQETPSSQCFICQMPLTVEEQDDSRFVVNQSCPYCFKTSAERMERTLEERHIAIREATTPLPGKQPYVNYRPVKVPAAYDGFPILGFLSGIFKHIPLEEWQALFEQKLILNADRQPVSPEHRVKAGEHYMRVYSDTREPDVNPNIRIVYEDEAIIVVNKPAPLPMHACGRFNRNTLEFILNRVYQPQKPRPAHRLDANTAGLVVYTRSRYLAGLLQPQFARREVEKVYLARVQGHPPADRFESTAAISVAAGELGSREPDDEAGLPAHTDFKVLQRYADGTSLLEVRPLTGRTNQIRVHLWQLGWPVCGDQAYLPGQRLGETQTNQVDDPPLCLFAHRLTFTHPLTQARMTFEKSPSWVDRCPEWRQPSPTMAANSLQGGC